MEETRILVVDDEQEIADLLELYLISDGYQVIKSEDALEGLAIMEREKIDLVLLDIMMPKMDGLEMCRKIREKHNVPIIMVSAKTQELDKIVGLTHHRGRRLHDQALQPSGADGKSEVTASALPGSESGE